MKNRHTFIYLFLSFIYSELVFRYFNHLNIFGGNILPTLFIALIVSCGLSFILDFLPRIANRIAINIITLIFGILFCANLCMNNFYGFYFEFNLLSLADQVVAFAGDGLKVVLNNIVGVVALLVPFILSFLLYIKYEEKTRVDFFVARIVIMVLATIGFCLTIFISKNDDTIYQKDFINGDITNRINDIGVINSTFIDAFETITHKEKEIVIIEEEPYEEVHEVINYGYNVLDIDFDKLLAENSSSSVKKITNYIMNSKGTRKNEYTGFFEGKNLILIMAESFNSIAVNKDLTPTLYKLSHNGFVFNNFYTPTILSTIGGEYSELTGMYPLSEGTAIFRKGSNSYPMGVGNMFKNLGYNVYAYHNNSYTFQDRDVYLKSLGFDYYKGCGNGLEKDVNCNNWPESDIEMINATYDEYIHDDHFMVFYASVSGHGPYVFDSKHDDIAVKYEDYLKEYYGDSLGTDGAARSLMAYEAGQIELDRALEVLLNKLDEAGVLNDTVIALAGDHHPYMLYSNLVDLDQYNRLSDHYRDETFGVYESNLIIYNAAMEENVYVDKVGTTMDVMPTLYNLFGLDYDSRLFAGNDILSNTPGLMITVGRSWISDYGRYYASSKEFVTDYDYIGDNYFEYTKNKAETAVNMSSLLMNYDYQNLAFKYLK